MAPKIAIAFFALAFIGVVAGFLCYSCDGDEKCKITMDKSKTGLECKDDSFCYTAIKDDKYFRGCQSFKGAMDKMKEKAFEYVTVCSDDMCNDVSTALDRTCVKCAYCGDMDKIKAGSQKCTEKLPICTTINYKNGTVLRGCTALSVLDPNLSNVEQACANDNCNKKNCDPIRRYSCYKCDKCETEKLNVTDCFAWNKGCFTKIEGKTVQRGCSFNATEWTTMETETKKVNGTLHEPCTSSVCNDEPLYKCTSCDDKEKCKATKEDDYVMCASKDYGCYIQQKDNEVVQKGCADNKAEWDKLQGEKIKVLPACRENLCNKNLNFQCYDCKGDDCKIIGDNTPKVNCSMEKKGCYISVKGKEFVRGCASQTEWDTMEKDNKTILSTPCTFDSCNKEKIYDCYSCHDDNKCKKTDDKDNVIETTGCMENCAGCYSVFNGEDTIRGCAKNQTNIEDLKKDKGEIKGPCSENTCNKENNPNASPGIQGSPTMIVSIVTIFGAYLMNY